MSTFLCGVIPGQCCDFSMGLEGQATSENFPVISLLQCSQFSHRVMSLIGSSSRCNLFILLAMSCMISVIQSAILIAYSLAYSSRQTNLEHFVYHPPLLHRLEGEGRSTVNDDLDRVASPSRTNLIFWTRPYTTSKVCAAVVRASSMVNLSSLCSTSSTSFSPQSFFINFTAMR